MGVVKLPLGYRRSDDAGRVKALWRLFEHFQGHVATIGPAVGRDLSRIDVGLLLEPARRCRLILDLDRAHCVIDLILERAPAVGRTAIVDLEVEDRKSTRLNSSHSSISYA